MEFMTAPELSSHFLFQSLLILVMLIKPSVHKHGAIAPSVSKLLVTPSRFAVPPGPASLGPQGALGGVGISAPLTLQPWPMGGIVHQPGPAWGPTAGRLQPSSASVCRKEPQPGAISQVSARLPSAASALFCVSRGARAAAGPVQLSRCHCAMTPARW